MQWLQNVIGGPRECLRVDSWDAYVAKVRAIRVGIGLDPSLKESRAPLPAHVSDGRWVFDCPCGSAGLASHEWGRGICVDCGTIHAVAFPEDRAEVEAALLARPRVVSRHYFPDEATAKQRRLVRAETLDDLHAENDALELPRKPGGLVRAKKAR